MIKNLDWDSAFFEMVVGELFVAEEIDAEEIKNFDLLYAKNPVDFDLKLDHFTNHFTETKVVFVKEIIENNCDSNNIFSVKKVAFQINKIYELAYESGKFSRFFLDTNFKPEKFKELYRKWVDNSISNNFATAVLVYVENHQTIGFVSYKVDYEDATIGLIAISPAHQGKGIGRKLLQFVENELFQNHIKTLHIPTQESNLGACNFYKKQGYTIKEKLVIKHYWKSH